MCSNGHNHHIFYFFFFFFILDVGNVSLLGEHRNIEKECFAFRNTQHTFATYV